MSGDANTGPKSGPEFQAKAPDAASLSAGLSEFVKTLVYALLIAGFIRTVFIQPFNIPSGSMIPTLLVGDYLFVSKWTYGYSRYSLPFGPEIGKGRLFLSPPQRGDIAVFKLPSDPSVDYIKRIVGLPGDRIQMKGGVLHINDEPVARERIEDYLLEDPMIGPRKVAAYKETLPNGVSYTTIALVDEGPYDNTGVFVVPEDHFFVMGDNRDNSQDSRVPGAVGYVPFDNLVGKARFMFFSIDGSQTLNPVSWPGAIRGGRLFSAIH